MKVKVIQGIIIVILIIGFIIGYYDSKGIKMIRKRMMPYGLWLHASVIPMFICFILILFFVSYDLLTFLRRTVFRMKLVTLFDSGLSFHRFAGYMLLLFSVYHSIFHMAYTVPMVAGPKEKEKSHNSIHDSKYFGVLFKSRACQTGLILLLCMILICITSLPYFRRTRFQLFSYTHMICFPIMMVCLVIHGTEGWFGKHTPLAIWFLTIPLLIYLVMIIRRAYNMNKNAFRVADVTFTENN